MSALPPDQTRSMRQFAASQVHDAAERHGLAAQWTSLHALGNKVGALAGLAGEPYQGQVAEFEHSLMNLSELRARLGQQGINDIRAMVSTGLDALETIADRGQDVTAPAVTLWREYFIARAALMDLVGVSSWQDSATD